MTRINRLTLWTVMGLLVVALSACSDTNKPKLASVKKETVAYTVTFDGRPLSHQEYDKLNAFVESVPTGSITYAGIAADDTNGHALAHAKWIRNYLVKQGISADTIYMQPTADADPHTLVLTLEYAKAVPPAPCPDWSTNPVKDYSNKDFSNFGCAYYNNLVVQLANPADYDKGHGQPAFDGARESVTIGKYLSGAASSGSSGGSASSGGASSGAAAPSLPSP